MTNCEYDGMLESILDLYIELTDIHPDELNDYQVSNTLLGVWETMCEYQLVVKSLAEKRQRWSITPAGIAAIS